MKIYLDDQIIEFFCLIEIKEQQFIYYILNDIINESLTVQKKDELYTNVYLRIMCKNTFILPVISYSESEFSNSAVVYSGFGSMSTSVLLTQSSPEHVSLHVLVGVGVALSDQRDGHPHVGPLQDQILSRQTVVPAFHSEVQAQVLTVTKNLVPQKLL